MGRPGQPSPGDRVGIPGRESSRGLCWCCLTQGRSPSGATLVPGLGGGRCSGHLPPPAPLAACDRRPQGESGGERRVQSTVSPLWSTGSRPLLPQAPPTPVPGVTDASLSRSTSSHAGHLALPRRVHAAAEGRPTAHGGPPGLSLPEYSVVLGIPRDMIAPRVLMGAPDVISRSRSAHSSSPSVCRALQGRRAEARAGTGAAEGDPSGPAQLPAASPLPARLTAHALLVKGRQTLS